MAEEARVPDEAIDAALAAYNGDYSRNWLVLNKPHRHAMQAGLEDAAPFIVAAAAVAGTDSQKGDGSSAPTSQTPAGTDSEQRLRDAIEALPMKTWRDAPPEISGMSDWASGYAAAIDALRAALASREGT